MGMRIGGLASGIDTDTIIKDLMKAERIPLTKMEQEKTMIEWQRDKFREINTKIKALDDFIADTMRMEKTYKTKSVSSTQENVVTATGTAIASEGAVRIEVKQLATAAINVSTVNEDINEQIKKYYNENDDKFVKFYTYDENNEQIEHKFEIEENDTISDIMQKINNLDSPVRAFYDEQSKQVVLEMTRTGNFNTSSEFGGAEIGFDDNSFFTNVLNFETETDEIGQVIIKGEQGGTDAIFTYNGALEISSKENHYTLNGITYEFKGTNEGNPATLTVTNDVDHAYDTIMEFVDKYNEIVEMMNDTQREQKYRDYPPLTEEQKKEMEEHEIELWEEKAKSGILKGDSIITSALTSLRQNLYQSIDNDSQFRLITELGISTTKDFLDGGKLEVDEDKLKDALREDPDSVYQFFVNGSEGSSRGLMNRIEDSLEEINKRINERAGRTFDTEASYILGKRLRDIDDRIDAFNDRLTRIENRYWKQFSAMEQAISRMNNQSAMLMQFANPMQ